MKVYCTSTKIVLGDYLKCLQYYCMPTSKIWRSVLGRTESGRSHAWWMVGVWHPRHSVRPIKKSHTHSIQVRDRITKYRRLLLKEICRFTTENVTAAAQKIPSIILWLPTWRDSQRWRSVSLNVESLQSTPLYSVESILNLHDHR